MPDSARIPPSDLFTRIGLRDPNQCWATNSWPAVDRTSEWGGRPGRRLWGQRDWWELTWGSCPFPDDVARAMTDP
ncbi:MULTISPECIES: hypothetical protein [unclassified Streptomyces]|uniref:hypothetical protein n=1 Tax=unclassified Streptomyces TaxID=2593676 RepID=UPI002476F7EF|nr:MULTISPECIES: hypothetical protein [unclassified Streptomyces]